METKQSTDSVISAENEASHIDYARLAAGVIERATELLQPISYEPNYIGFFVKQNDVDMGNEDYCKKCINSAIWHAQKHHREQRAKLLDKYKQITETGYYNGNDCRHYPSDMVQHSMEAELKEYPAKVKFTYEGHDPDFGGGETEPLSCAKCGHYFHTNFEANLETAQSLLEEFGEGKKIAESLKWKLDIAFYNYDYVEADVQEILLKIANVIVNVEVSDTCC